MEITVKNLQKSFPRLGRDPLVVLDGVDFDVRHGEFVTLLGPTGCGKTTILKIIANIEKKDKGEIKVHPSLTDNSLPIIWQDHRLLPWRTVLGNITLPLELRKIKLKNAEKKARELLKLMALDEFENYFPSQISGGMAARVAIARVLVTGSKCLLMDEPFAAIDYQTKLRLFEEIQHLRKHRGLTILYVTHDIRDAIRFSDRVVVLTKRPARVVEIIKPVAVDLPHTELEEHLWSLLR